MQTSATAHAPEAHPDEADTVVAAHVALRSELIPDPKSWVHRSAGIIASAAEIACPTCNTIYVYGGEAGEDEVTDVVSRFAARGLPFHVSMRSSLAARYAPIAEREGLTHLVDLPLMTVTPAQFRPAEVPGELGLRVLPPGAEACHLNLVAQGLGMSLHGLAHLMSPANLASPAWTTYVGEADGALAVTGSAIAGPTGTGLISIVTDPRFARRGYAAALTSQAITDAFRKGQPRVFLHSSAQGLKVYERLGFRMVEKLSVYGRADESH